MMLGEWRMWLDKARTMALDDQELDRKGTKAGAAVDGTVRSLVGLDRHLGRIGVKLVIAVVPFKEAVYADVINPELGTPPPRLDHQMQRFVQKLQAAGVAVVDTTPMLLAERTKSKEDVFSKLGYNWSPHGGFLCGREVARVIREKGWCGKRPPPAGKGHVEDVKRPGGEGHKPPAHWYESDAPVITLGDNSLKHYLRFADGVADGLSVKVYNLGFCGTTPVAQWRNIYGAAIRSPDHFAQLRKKKVVIWSQGAWAIFSGDMLGYDPKTDRFTKLPPLVAPDPTKSFKPEPVEVYAELEATSTARTPKQLFPYKDSLVFDVWIVKHVTKGAYPYDRIVVARWGVRDGKTLKPALGHRIGKRHRLRLEPLEKHKHLSKVARDRDAYTDISLPPYLITN